MVSVANVQSAALELTLRDGVSAAAGKAAEAMERLGKASETTEQTVRRTGPTLEQLNRRLDETERLTARTEQANRRYEQTLETLRREREAGNVTAEREAELTQRAATLREQEIARARRQAEAMRQAYGVQAESGSIAAAYATQAARSTAAMASANDNATRSGRGLGQVLGQAGYQIQDFAVQVAAGQNALVAFAQQGSQLLGIFGTAGAVAGAVLTVGVLVAQMFGLGRSTREAKSATDEFNEALRASGQFLETAEERTRRLYEEKRKETQETLRSAAALQMERLARAQSAEQRAVDDLAAIQRSPADPRPGMRDRAVEQVNRSLTRSREVANDAALALGRLLDEYEKVSRAEPEATRAIRSGRDANADAARAEREWQKVLEEGERVRQSTLTETEKFAETQEKLNDLLATGAIDAVTYARALSAADPAVKAAADARKQILEVDNLVAAEARRAQGSFERDLERCVELPSEMNTAEVADDFEREIR